MVSKKKSKTSDNTIATNRVVRHDYSIEDDLEVGIVLEGWEVKSLRNNNLQLKESYVMAKNGELRLIGAHISALNTASTHISPIATRTRKLLAHQREINRLSNVKGSEDMLGLAIEMARSGENRDSIKNKTGLRDDEIEAIYTYYRK